MIQQAMNGLQAMREASGGRPSARPAARIERRGGDRRGTRVRVIRFNGDRRAGAERRQRARRGFDRAPLRLPVLLRYEGLDQACISEDLSVLGTSLLGSPRLPVGSLVRLTFELPDDLPEFPLVSWAQVCSAPEGRAPGYRFVGLRACDARRIGRLFASRGEPALAGGMSF